MILQMAAAAWGPAGRHGRRTLAHRTGNSSAWRGRVAVRFRGPPAVLYLGANHPRLPRRAVRGLPSPGVPALPLNYRARRRAVEALEERRPGAVVLRPDDLDSLLPRPHRNPKGRPRGGRRGAAAVRRGPPSR
ncbi:hypothetical protein ACU686_27345 [Yinghuangia aomiensis]